MKTVGLFPSAQAVLHADKKQHKKKKKKKAKRRRSTSSSSSSDGDQWVEKPSTVTASATLQPSAASDRNVPSLAEAAEPAAPKRDAWMEVEDIFAGVTAGEARDRRRQTKQQVREAEERQRQADYEARKWREPTEGSVKPAAPVGDGGVGWLRRALQRAKQQAAESGRPLEEIVAERWGSMEKLQSMLDAAERRSMPAQPAVSVERTARERGWRRGSDRCRSGSRERRRSGSGDRRRSRSRERRKERDRERSKSRERRRSRSKERRDRSRSRGRRKRSWSRDRRKDRSRSRDRRRERSESRDRRRGRSGSRDRRRERSRSRDRRRERSRSRDRKRDRSGSRERRRDADEKDGRGKDMGMADRNHGAEKAKSPSRRKRNETDDRGNESPSSAAARNGQENRESSNSRHATYSSRSADAVKSSHFRLPPANQESDSADDDEDRKSSRAESARPLTDSEMNALAAKILKAELNGDDDDAAELQKQLDAARQLRAAGATARPAEKAEKVVVVVGKGEKGPAGGDSRPSKKRKADTHRDGERTKYFADDDRLELRDMFERERRTTPADEAAALAQLTARGVRQTRHHEDDHGLDEQLAERAGRAEPERAQDERAAARARAQHRHLERCTRCFDSRHTLRHLIAALGEKSYLSLPAGRSVTQHHCLIVPLQHAVSLTAVEEDAWEEMGRFRAALVAMFAADDQDVVFFESALKLRTHPHAVLHCVPVPRETGEMAPIYFKKALEESETEWSQNKKVVDLRGRDVRRAVPKGLPYFFVDFGLQPGFAHVVEDEALFPENFAQEIIGGMLDLDPSAWRRSKDETPEQQRKKAMDFAKIWEPHDFTREG